MIIKGCFQLYQPQNILLFHTFPYMTTCTTTAQPTVITMFLKQSRFSLNNITKYSIRNIQGEDYQT